MNRVVDIERIWWVFGKFFELFLTSIQEIGEVRELCKTLQKLYVPFEDRDVMDDNNAPKQLCPKIASKLATMFPIVHNKFLNNARIKENLS
jgi:hypothetical protein